jgi:hypothetical protein
MWTYNLLSVSLLYNPGQSVSRIVYYRGLCSYYCSLRCRYSMTVCILWTWYEALGQLIWSVIPIPISSGLGQDLNHDKDLRLLQIKSFHSGLIRSAGSHRMKASTGSAIWAGMSRYRVRALGIEVSRASCI